MAGFEQPAKSLMPSEFRRLADLGRSLLGAWDTEWKGIEQQVHTAGHGVLCREGCVPCCYARRFCSLPEAAAIIDYIVTRFPAGMQEDLRLRVESATSSLRRLAEDGLCDSDEGFFRAGGLPCPFLEDGHCEIYPVRPLECRAVFKTIGEGAVDCRRCSLPEQCAPGFPVLQQLRDKSQEGETALGLARDPAQPRFLAEALSELWAQDAPSGFAFFVKDTLRTRLACRGSCHDQTWQDDRQDYQSLAVPLSFPAEGDYEGGLTLLREELDKHELYGRRVAMPDVPAAYTLYKRHPGCQFDWAERKFRWEGQRNSALPYSDRWLGGLQKRMMLWEAAKRSRGKVLCAGLGLGIFPQFALSFPRVECVHAVESDSHVVQLMTETWSKQAWPGVERCAITSTSVEEYLAGTPEKYDTVCLDFGDVIDFECLPHLNELTARAERVLAPGGEVLVVARDLMVRHFLRTAVRVAEQRTEYLAAGAAQMESMAERQGLLPRLVSWLTQHPDCTEEQLLTEAYHLAVGVREAAGPRSDSETAASPAPIIMAQQEREDSTPSAPSIWEQYRDALRGGLVGDAMISSCRSACGGTFAKDRENLSRFYRLFKPKEIGCLGSGCLNDIPIEEFLRGGSRVWLVDWIPGISEKSFAFDLIRSDDAGHACILCNLPGGGEHFCKNFKAPEQKAHVCDNFCLTEGFPPRCARYAPGSEPRFITCDTTLGRATCFATSAERIVARAKTPAECFQAALEECRRSCWKLNRKLDIPDGTLDFVSSVMVMSQFEHEPFTFFSRLLARRFGEERLAKEEEHLAPLMEGLRAELLRMQVEGHAREMYRLVNKKRGHAYFSVELFEKHADRKDFFVVEGAASMLETLGNYFFFDFEALPLDRALRRVNVGEGRSVVQSFLLAPAPQPRRGD